MRATALARPNIALVKYWGKRDRRRNLPAVGSISVTLDTLYTKTTVSFDEALDADRLTINGSQAPDALQRVSRCLDHVAGDTRSCAEVESSSNFPIAAGLASSASGFAALVAAASAAAGQTSSVNALARLAGAASGSAARSFFGGFVELQNTSQSIALESICTHDEWPLGVAVAITSTEHKAISSTTAMEASRKTSPFYGEWLRQQATDLEKARAAIQLRDFDGLADVAEHNCLKMHSLMWTSRPSVVYWNSATLACIRAVRELRQSGLGVFFTIDAGPQVKAICSVDDLPQVAAALAAQAGVVEVLQSGLGPGAQLLASP